VLIATWFVKCLGFVAMKYLVVAAQEFKEKEAAEKNASRGSKADEKEAVNYHWRKQRQGQNLGTSMISVQFGCIKR